MNKKIRKLLNYLIAVFVSFCCVCLVLSLAVYSSDSTLFTPAPASRLPEINLSTVIAQTYSAAQIQTQVLSTPIPLFTTTFTPTVTMLPTATLSEIEIQTAQALATYYANPTPTIMPFVFPTSDGEIYIPPSSNGDCEPAYPDVCINGNPRLNCVDLRAKGIFHFRVLSSDPLGYDKDNDGIGCE